MAGCAHCGPADQVVFHSDGAIVVGLAGNPNTGKSSAFNHLTGSKQHVGNWPGKTVAKAHGTFTHHDQEIFLKVVILVCMLWLVWRDHRK